MRNKPSSLLILILVHLYPIAGVLLMGWDVFPIMFLFWSENVIIGFYNVLRLLTCRPKEKIGWFARIFTIIFFIVHYGGFTIGHAFFVIALFARHILVDAPGPKLEVLMQTLWQYKLPYAMLALFISHGYSFFVNYLGKGEYRRYNVGTLMKLPYTRVILLHITLMLGGGLMLVLHSPMVGLFLLILLKIGMDIRAHTKEHKNT